MLDLIDWSTLALKRYVVVVSLYELIKTCLCVSDYYQLAVYRHQAVYVSDDG